MTFWQFLVSHWGYISAAILLVLKWVYNSWTPDVTFPQFVRQFIGEVVQEQPRAPLTFPQQKTLADAGELPHA